MHILVPLKGIEFGHFYDGKTDDTLSEDRLRTIGDQLLGQPLSPNYGWQSDSGAAYIAKPVPVLSDKDSWQRSRQLYNGRECVNLTSRTQQILGEGVVVRLVDLPIIAKRQEYDTHLDQIRQHCQTGYAPEERPILLPGDELAL